MNKYLFILALIFISIQGIQAQSNTRGQSEKVKAAEAKAKVDSLIPQDKQVRIKSQKTKMVLDAEKLYEQRIAMEKIEGVYIPRDLLDCFKQLDTLMDEDVRERFMAFSDEEVDKRTHASLGKWIDHKWSLTEGSRLRAYFHKMKVSHPDHMVGIIITSYHRHLHKRDLKVKEQVKHFQKIWQETQKKEAAALLLEQNAK